MKSSSPTDEHDHDHIEGHNHDHDHSHEHHEHHEHHHAEGEHCDHVHAEETCDHNHNHDDACGHDHAHGLNPWRYIVLLLPIVLYFLGLPNAGLTVHGGSTAELEQANGTFVENTGLKIIKDEGKEGVRVVGVAQTSPAAKAGIKSGDRIFQISRLDSADGKPLANPEIVALKDLSAEAAAKVLGGKPQTRVKVTVKREGAEKPDEVELTRAMDVLALGFKELDRGSYSPDARNFYDGRTVRLKGQFAAGQDKRSFSLVRLKIQCCAADAIPLNVVIRLDPQAQGDLQSFGANTWVEVTGRVEYLKKKDKDEYVAVLNVAQPADVIPTQPDNNPYIQ
jgi:hypothetical protein